MYTHNCKSYFVRPNIHETQEIAVAEGLSAMPKQLVQKPMQSFVCINDAHGSNPKKNVSNTLMRIMIDFYVTYLRPTNVYDFNEYT